MTETTIKARDLLTLSRRGTLASLYSEDDEFEGNEWEILRLAVSGEDTTPFEIVGPITATWEQDGQRVSARVVL